MTSRSSGQPAHTPSSFRLPPPRRCSSGVRRRAILITTRAAWEVHSPPRRPRNDESSGTSICQRDSPSSRSAGAAELRTVVACGGRARLYVITSGVFAESPHTITLRSRHGRSDPARARRSGELRRRPADDRLSGVSAQDGLACRPTGDRARRQRIERPRGRACQDCVARHSGDRVEREHGIRRWMQPRDPGSRRTRLRRARQQRRRRRSGLAASARKHAAQRSSAWRGLSEDLAGGSLPRGLAGRAGRGARGHRSPHARRAPERGSARRTARRRSDVVRRGVVPTRGSGSTGR